MNKHAFDDTVGVLKYAYNTLNTLGKLALLPLFVLVSPVVFFVCLAMKHD